MIAYFDLAKNKFGIKNEDDLTKVFVQFIEATPEVHPLALGNVNRTHNLIRLLAKRLLKSHKKPMSEGEIEKVVEDFTEKLYSHQYFIGRKEAKEELGLKSVVYADPNLSKAMGDLYDSYQEEMGLGITVWNPELEMGNTGLTTKAYKIAQIESAVSSNAFEIKLEFKRQQVMTTQQGPQGPMQVPMEQVAPRAVEQGWK